MDLVPSKDDKTAAAVIKTEIKTENLQAEDMEISNSP